MDRLPIEFTQTYFHANRPTNGWPDRFAIITAHNPDGRISEPAANLAADTALRDYLLQLGFVHFRVTGGSKDGRHQEPGWGVVLAEPKPAQELSIKFRQLAFFWVAQGRLKLVDARTGEGTDQAAWIERWLGPNSQEATT